MKNTLKIVAGIMALISVSTILQAAASASISNDEGLQIRSQTQEMTSEIDRLNKNAVNSVRQSQRITVEMLSPSTSEAFLEQVRIKRF
jgi:hypothetical protein